MKVPSLFSSKPLARRVAACTFALVLGAGAAAPLTAIAEMAPLRPAPFEAIGSLVPTTTLPGSLEATGPLSSVDPTSVASVSATVTLSAKKAAVKKKKRLTVRQTIAKVARARGLARRHVKALLWIAKRESNFHRTSVSRSGCYGLFQLSHSMVRGRPWKSAAWNTKRAIKYMRGRYGGVLQAKAFWQAHHWY